MKKEDIHEGMKVRVKPNILELDKAYKEKIHIYLGKVLTVTSVSSHEFGIYLDNCCYCFKAEYLNPVIDKAMQKLKEAMLG